MFQNSQINVIIITDQAIINLCHTLGKEIGGLSSIMETQAVFLDICPFFDDTNLPFWIKRMHNHASLRDNTSGNLDTRYKKKQYAKDKFKRLLLLQIF